MRRLCTVCARGGSKGVESKNLRPINGKPLLAYTLLQAAQSQLFDAIALSSDSPEVLAVAESYGVDQLVLRPDDLASDTAAKLPAIVHCVETAEERLGWRASTVVDLDATSPLRWPSDIVGAVELVEQDGASNVLTGARARRSPYFNLVEVSDDGRVQLSKEPDRAIVRRQDTPSCFDLNASIYVWGRDFLSVQQGLFQKATRLYEMPEDRSIDIDSPLDWEIVRYLLNERDAEPT